MMSIEALTDQLWLLPATALLGLCVGSFLNVVIHRLPLMLQRQWRAQCREVLALPPAAEDVDEVSPALNLAHPRSHCPVCRQTLGVADLLPLLGFLRRRGRCRHCGAAISWRYPLVEAGTALLSVVVVAEYGATLPSLVLLVFVWFLVALALIDTEHLLLPDDLTLPLLWLGLLANSMAWVVPLHAALYGAVAGYLLLWVVSRAFRRLTGKEGIGEGDLKLLAALGAWLGWQALPLIIVLASLLGSLTGLVLIVFHQRDRHAAIPFGPFLAVAGCTALLGGERLQLALFGLLH
jgi:leader peptidase (prepilin peptidase)/N-methyltransferase